MIQQNLLATQMRFGSDLVQTILQPKIKLSYMVQNGSTYRTTIPPL
jgi:hypothetical protein